MKTLRTIGFIAALLMSLHGLAQEQLAPDQNPNYKRSQEKYMATSDSLIASEGQTIQRTYQAIDEFHLKKRQRQARKQQKREWKHDERMARYSNPGYNRGYSNGGYYGGYNNGGYYPYGNSGYGGGYYGGTNWGNVITTTVNTALWGYLLYNIFK
jgi:rSAM-associated Gly-rich repeat protein